MGTYSKSAASVANPSAGNAASSKFSVVVVRGGIKGKREFRLKSCPLSYFFCKYFYADAAIARKAVSLVEHGFAAAIRRHEIRKCELLIGDGDNAFLRLRSDHGLAFNHDLGQTNWLQR